MNKNIHYNGLTAVPSDYECADGDLALSFNLISRDGALHPLMPPSCVLSIANRITNPQTGAKFAAPQAVYIHKTASYSHLLVRADKTSSVFVWFDLNDTSAEPVPLIPVNFQSAIGPGPLVDDDIDIYGYNSIGNTLVILTSEGMHYFLWSDNVYSHLGTHLPECPISFGLSGALKSTEGFLLGFGNEGLPQTYGEFGDSDKESVSLALLSAVNSFIAEHSLNQDRFMMPFFVRYAYRLYDGTLTMQSAPILMMTATEITPRAIVHNGVAGFNTHNDRYTSATCAIIGMSHALDYIADTEAKQQLLKWSDIIKSIDIFVSKPIYYYDQNGTVKEIFDNAAGYSFPPAPTLCISSLTNTNDPSHIQRNMLAMTQQSWWTSNGNPSYAGIEVGLPRRDDEEVRKDIQDESLFYLIHSININDLEVSNRKIIELAEGTLKSLTTRETLPDDYNSHDLTIPTTSFNYNSRLHISGLRRVLFDGFPAGALFTVSDATAATHAASVYVFIKTDGVETILRAKDSLNSFSDSSSFVWFYYPNTNAYKAGIVYNGGYYEVELTKHAMLNGAFFFKEWSSIVSLANKKSVFPSVSSSALLGDIANKIYTSEVNNPFSFPLLGINTVGSGHVLGISTAARALSQGQFGQFPLYAFTDEGVWALEISSSGSFSARQPITRDVCINPAAITQLDSAVLFPTARGIMLITGSQTQCITDPVYTDTPFNILTLPHMDSLHAMLGHSDTTCIPTIPILEYMRNCGIIYDYVGQRIILFSPVYTYAYVYSLQSKAWGMITSDIQCSLNSYPEAYAFTSALEVVDYGGRSSGKTTCLYVTRPLKLDAPDILKTIDTVIQRGMFTRGDVSTVLYGSRNLMDWHLIWSSTDHYLQGFRGTPYKYFRIAGVASLAIGNSIFGATVQFSPRLTDKHR